VKVVAFLLVVVVFFYAFYNGAAAIWSYMELSAVVDRALEDRGRAGAVAVHEAIVHGAGQAGVPLRETNVLVSEEAGVYSVRVHWTWPVLTYQGKDVLEIPISLSRSFRRP
jgi:hypothetical protein